MSFAILEQEVKSLPQELQDNIETYILFVINQFKKTANKSRKTKSATEIIENLTGIIKTQEPITMKDVHAERLQNRYGV